MTDQHSPTIGHECSSCHQSDEQDTLTESDKEVLQQAIRWGSEHGALSRAAFDQLDSRFIRTVGETVHVGGHQNHHLRYASASAFGEFSYREEIPLVEIGEESQYADIVGVPYGEGWVPVLVCFDGDAQAAVTRGHQLYHGLSAYCTAAPRVLPDGGTPPVDDEKNDDMQLRLRGFGDGGGSV